MKIILFIFLASGYTWAFDQCLIDVKDQFESLSPNGRDIHIKVKNGIFEDKSYTSRALNNLGIDNHFQGIQKLPGKNNFVITGGDFKRKNADLLIINNGEFVKRESVDKWPYWHSGGIQILGNILAVPVEEWKKLKIARIHFFDFSDVLNPKELPIFIDIPKTKAGAVLFYRFPDGKYLVGSYDEITINFYFSKTENLFDGFELKPRFSFEPKKFNIGERKPFKFGAQAVNLISQCDGKLFMVLTENTGKAAPVFNKDDRALLFSFDLNENENPVSLVSIKTFDCHKKCNFAAATGIHIDDRGKLFLYSSPHYLSFKQDSYNIREFSEK